MPHTHESRLAALRDALAEEKLAGFIVPKADEFQNEAVPACWDRLAWLTGFTGSAGTAVVLADKAALIVDSRYTLQAKAQVDTALYAVELFPKVTLAKWLGEHAGEGAAIGYDPSLFTQASFKPLKAEAEKAGFELRAIKANPIDALWEDRPAPSFAPIVFHDEAFAGESAASKLERVQKEIAARKATGLIVSAPDAVAWLFNIRGGDVAHTPVALARAYVPLKGQPTLFVSPGHVTDENREGLEALAALHPLGDLWKVLPRLVGAAAKVIADPAYTTLRVADILKVAGAKVIEGDDPSIRFKAAKNATELEGARAAHLRDGVAVAQFLAWLDASAPSGTVDELAASDRLEAFRRDTGKLVDLSFDTISGAGSNGAIVHYRATPQTKKPLLPGTVYLIDSGGQYRDGTTDITRTVAIGEPSADMRRHYTLVLKGHIGIATARFPAKTNGAALDSFARRALWDAGLDYGHGTGHGVGSFLSVHEGPANISPRGTVALEPGMILSNEPGYYREGQYGIRLENLIAVTPAQGIDGGETEMLGFETLTLAPFDRRLIDAALLSPAERDWLNAYHARVREALAPHLDDVDRAWLDAATAEI
ncbi:aminopeptidase P family protein [Rhodomicrobium vannielii ATCC 17100]|uniref:aminopeptidase P family protein n=1 Tax=Rhodomicrobium vannielii TaxID=1069 RepID=UPI00191807DD|nr:aminopeptidase P family protein [Rhodomicrobium vannielii]MBJ7532931.1 aminopeptidase P family protein [Rhodomicrobium vannielii ATCC 17100]